MAPANTQPTSTSTSSKSAQPPRRGKRALLWRLGEDDDYGLVVDEEQVAQLSDPERAAVAYLASSIGSDCEWGVRPTWSSDGSIKPGKLRCKLTDALELGYQCEEKHHQFVKRWLGDATPAKCAKVPFTAYSQTAFDWLNLTTQGHTIAVSYSAGFTTGPGRRTWSWSETINFTDSGGESLKIVSQVLTSGQPPKWWRKR